MTEHRPIALLAELTHRCPLSCPYCSNPVVPTLRGDELSFLDWMRVLTQAADLGVRQVTLSGGEPALRTDLVAIVQAATMVDLYVNLHTSGRGLGLARLRALADAGLAHVQLSFQHTEEASADRLAGNRGSHRHKLGVARAVRSLGMALTVNVVLHGGNIDRLDDFVDLALQLDAGALELAHMQHHGHALTDGRLLEPTRAQVDSALAWWDDYQHPPQVSGRLKVSMANPDWHTGQPNRCLGGWGRQAIVVTPSGDILPCHGAAAIPMQDIPTTRTHSLAGAWASPLFDLYRGTAWAPEPCRSCDRLQVDYGGCRCQALAILGDASLTDPACRYSPARGRIDERLA